MEERLQKLISAAGLCSRRAAEGLLTEGRVTVNGLIARLGEKADPDRDDIWVDCAPLGRAVKPVYLLLNKPRGYITTMSDEKGRPTVAELVQDCGVRVLPVGRLDYDSQGLLLMTNDGALIQKMTHPSFEVAKTYLVRVAGGAADVAAAAERLVAVTELDGERIAPARVKLLRAGRETAVLSVTIHQGLNRQIRRMCEQCALDVKQLQRVEEHGLRLGDLPEGKWRKLTVAELVTLQAE